MLVVAAVCLPIALLCFATDAYREGIGDEGTQDRASLMGIRWTLKRDG